MLEMYSLPLLHDHHTHVTQYASLIDCLNIQDINSKEKALKLIRAVDERPTVVLGWDSSNYSFESEELDELEPLLICNRSLHGFIINQGAKGLLKEEHEELVKNIEDEDWVERNLPKILREISAIKSCSPKKIESFFKSMEEKGIWYADDMLLSSEEDYYLFRRTQYSDRTDFWADLELFEELNEGLKEKIKGVKLFTDGALGARTAAVTEKYDTGSKGILLHSNKELKDTLLGLDPKVDDIAIHAIGERAIDQVVKVVDELDDEALPDLRMEHAAFISEKTAKKALDLDITLCMQPNFSFNSVDFTDRLSEEYLKKNNPFRMLIDKVGYEPGKDLIFGSDGMPHGVDYALRSALFPPLENQKLTMDEFERGYCMDDRKKGEIEVKIDREEEEIKTDVDIFD